MKKEFWVMRLEVIKEEDRDSNWDKYVALANLKEKLKQKFGEVAK